MNPVKVKVVPMLNELSTTHLRRMGRVDVYIHIFLTSALAGGVWSASRPDSFTPAERAPGTHWIGSWVDPRAGPDVLGKRKFLTLPGLELRPLGHLPYRLRYPASSTNPVSNPKPPSIVNMTRQYEQSDPATVVIQLGSLSIS
jgi:hypothetical protein